MMQRPGTLFRDTIPSNPYEMGILKPILLNNRVRNSYKNSN